MRRRQAVGIALVVVAALVYWLGVREKAVEPQLRAAQATATIGSGVDAVAVGPDGQILAWYPLSEEAALPSLPISAPPESGELAGPVLEQARVLGAAPAPLRPSIERSYYGESGVDVELRSGIELRFGDASQAAVKWKAAAAVLADPSIEALDYVDLHAPRRPAVGGSGHTLPPVE
ncbi:MAG TPA: cell division protein FtsQ/DivIB [Solirubrobacterales bacterium]